MKKIFILLTMNLLIVMTSMSQTNNMIVFTLEPQPFYVILNGIRQNEDPKTNVKITELPGEFYRMKVIFADGKTRDLDKSISYLEMGKEVSLELRLKKGKWKVRYAGEVALNATPNIPNQLNVVYHESPATTTTNTTTTQTQPSKAPVQEKPNTDNRQNQTTTNTQTGGTINTTISTVETQTDTQGSQVNISISETGMNMNITIQDPTLDLDMSNAGEVRQNNQTTTFSGFMNNGGMCSSPSMSQRDFMDLKYKIEAENMFNREKLILATFQNNCMLASQVAGIIQLKYSTVDEMTIAKQGYRHTYDTENYGEVVNSIQSPSKQKELLTFFNASMSTTSTSTSQSTTTTSQQTTTGAISTTISINETIGNTQPTTTAAPATGGTMTSNEDTGGSRQESTNTMNQLVDYGWVSGYAGPIGCYHGRLVNDEGIIKLAEEESFSESRMSIVKQAAKGKCFTVDQISSISEVFTFEEDKLSFVKWAYDFTYDVDNYFTLNSIFTFSASKDELNKYLDDK